MSRFNTSRNELNPIKPNQVITGVNKPWRVGGVIPLPKNYAYGLVMALICPRCESKDPKDFYIVQGKVNRGFAHNPTRWLF